MKKFFTVLALTGAAAIAWPAFAGEQECGFSCENACPLAQQANTHRAGGTEAVAASEVVRADVAKLVETNLDRI